MPAAADGPRCATWSILWACRLIAFTRSIWISYPVAMPRTRSAPVFFACWATARIGGMLSPGCEYSAARKVSWKSSSRTATPFAQAAHSGLECFVMPKTVEPGVAGCVSACARAEMAGARVMDAAATAALSMMRLITISVTSGVTGTGSAATSAIFQASCSWRGRFSSLL